MTEAVTQRGFGWWNDPWELERYVCPVCEGLHCYWCGREFNLLPTHRQTLAGPSREHVDAFKDSGGQRWRGSQTVIAHHGCNSARGHAVWTWFHRPGARLRAQEQAAVDVANALARANDRSRP